MAATAKSIKLTILFCTILVLIAFDIWFDFQYGIPVKHLLIEGVVFLLCLVGFNYFSSMAYKSYQAQVSQVQNLRTDIQKKDQELFNLNKVVKSYKDEFRLEIEQTFKKWSFTKAEAEVAGLLLKGLSLKEIADLRQSNERTVRTQCSSIYKKSKLENRSQLSSYFLDDLI